jgi:predicted transposase YdaD
MKQIIQNKPDFKEKIMTYAECLREKGKQKGIQIGKQEGIQIGEQKEIKSLIKPLH